MLTCQLTTYNLQPHQMKIWENKIIPKAHFEEELFNM